MLRVRAGVSCVWRDGLLRVWVGVLAVQSVQCVVGLLVVLPAAVTCEPDQQRLGSAW